MARKKYEKIKGLMVIWSLKERKNNLILKYFYGIKIRWSCFMNHPVE